MINGCIAAFPQDRPVVLVAVFDVWIDGHPLGSHPLDISWACVVQHLLGGGLGVDGFYIPDESVQNWLIFCTTDHPVPGLVDPLVQSSDLLLAKVCFFAVEHLKVVPIWYLHVEIQINSAVLLHHQQPQHISSLDDGVILMPNVVLFGKLFLSLCAQYFARAVVCETLLVLFVV